MVNGVQVNLNSCGGSSLKRCLPSPRYQSKHVRSKLRRLTFTGIVPPLGAVFGFHAEALGSLRMVLASGGVAASTSPIGEVIASKSFRSYCGRWRGLVAPVYDPSVVLFLGCLELFMLFWQFLRIVMTDISNRSREVRHGIIFAGVWI